MQLLPKLFQTIPLLCLLLTGCASLGEVKKKDRDLSNSYDGVWTGEYETTKRYQQYSNWTFTCQQETSPLTLRIEDSRIQTLVSHKYVESLNETYISSTGKFKTTLPSSYKAKTSKHSDTQDSDIETRMIIEGILNPVGQGTGKFTFGYATSQFKGCNTELNFTSSQKLTENQTGTIPNLDDLEVASGQISSLEFYGQAEEEINTKTYDKNLWAKALVDAQGDVQKRKPRYIELRATQLNSENGESISTASLNQLTAANSTESNIDISGSYLSEVTNKRLNSIRMRDGNILVILEQHGDTITGTDSSGKTKIRGTIKGDIIKFEFYSPNTTYAVTLKGEWRVNADGTQLEGSWKARGAYMGSIGRWDLKKVE